MACEDCMRDQEEGRMKYYYRWKNASILIMGCKAHVKEVMLALDEKQKEEK